MKRNLLFVALALVLVLCACNRARFVKLIEGTWKVNNYYYNGQNMTSTFDTTNSGYQLVISSGYTYTLSWKKYTFTRDSIIKSDTVSGIVYHDTIPFVDTTITPYSSTGVWTLINSEEDLQLRTNDGSADSSVTIYNILKLTKNDLNLLNGNQEYDLTK